MLAHIRGLAMRAFVDLVDSFTGVVRFIILAIIVVGLGITFMLTAGVSYVAPKVAEEAGERATAFGERAMEEARQSQRERDLAKDGWGYGSADGSQNPNSGSRSRDGYGSDGGGWGDDAQ